MLSLLEFVSDMDQRPALAEARRKLFEVREMRIHPGLDEKELTSWNGLMLAAVAEAARTLNREDYQSVAEHNADFLLRELRQENGRLLRTIGLQMSVAWRIVGWPARNFRILA